MKITAGGAKKMKVGGEKFQETLSEPARLLMRVLQCSQQSLRWMPSNPISVCNKEAWP